MERTFFAILVMCFFASCGGSSGSGSSATSGVTVGYEGVAAFSGLTASDYTGVKGLKVFFQHASVGQNTVNGLTAVNDSDSKYGLSLYSGTAEQITAEFEAGSAHFADCFQSNDGWQAKMDNFKIRMEGGVAAAADVCMMKLCYIDSWESSSPKADCTAKFNAYRDMMLGMEAKYPQTTFIWWTMPICTAGDAERDGFNALVRAYASDNKKWLFDVASVESHDASGNPQSDAAGEILVAGYNSGDGGHPNTPAGELRLGQALYVLLAKVAAARAQ